MSLKLQTIIVSTRPNRIGPKVANWFHRFAIRHGKFDATLIDLCDFKLPLYNEPHHPRLQKYEHEHTRKWSASVAAADAYVFVTPEYNYCPPPGFGNSLNYLSTSGTTRLAALSVTAAYPGVCVRCSWKNSWSPP